MSVLCLAANCDITSPSYGKPGTRKGEYCRKHAPINYTNVTHKRCSFENCDSTSRKYGKPGTKKGEYCRKHSPEGYIDVVSKRCLAENCDCTYPSYGDPKIGKREYCRKHAPANYTNVVSKRCLVEDCKSVCPKYGKPGTKKGEYCKKHAPDGHVNVTTKRCLSENCDTQPIYGKPGTKNREYCKYHAPTGYTSVAGKRCLFENCESIRPSFGVPGTKKGEYCRKHAPIEYVDVVHKRCLAVNCNINPNYGFSGYSAEYCCKHKLPRMIIYPKNKPKAQDIVCQFCSNSIHYNEIYCSGCKRYLELKTTVKSKEKELRVMTLLDDHKIEYINDQRVTDGCSSRRPDFQICSNNGIIILEVDENQHRSKTYSCECEITRMKQIYYDCGVSHLLFIRYNPDKYKALNGAVFNQDKREDLLIKLIQKYIDDKFPSNLGVLYLFYDGFSMNLEPEEIVVI